MIRFINPNYHVILIHYPLALLAVGLLIELLAMRWPAASLRAAGWWMILLGSMFSAPAAASGIFAKYDIMQQLAGDDASTWREVRASAALTKYQWHLLNRHVLYSSIGTVMGLLASVVWLGSSSKWPRSPGAALWTIYAVSMGLMVVGAHGAGELVYRTQFATRPQAVMDKLEDDWKSRVASAEGTEKLQARLDYYVDPLQVHVIAAGVLAALIAAAWGASFQKATQLRRRPPIVGDEQEKPPEAAVAPATGLWILAALAGAGTLLLGWYVFSSDAPSPWDVVAVFRFAILEPFRKDPAGSARVLVHLLLGGGIILLAVILVFAAKWGGRSRLLAGFLGLLLIALVAAQVWVGILMLYDTNSGPLMRFTPAAPAASSSTITANAGN